MTLTYGSDRMFRLYVFLQTVIGLTAPTQSSRILADTRPLGSQLIGQKPVTQDRLIRFQIEKIFRVHTTRSRRDTTLIIHQLIEEANPKHYDLNRSEANELSRTLVQVSECYGIDPLIYSSLIWRESKFRAHATSPSGAVGLSQMTNQGIEEVLDRLSPRSARRLGHLRALTKRCDPNFLIRVPILASADTLQAWKNSVLFNHRDALVMGALLLKVNLAAVQSKRGDQMEMYRIALEHYNGEPLVKMQFASDILNLTAKLNRPALVALNDSKFLKSF